MIALIANPEKFAGRTVQVIGFVSLEFERNALYLSREAAEIGDASSAIWLDVGGLNVPRPQDYHSRYVIVAGRFNAANRGHMGVFAGTIESISRLELWRK